MKRFGRCYELNFLFQLEHTDYILVHGYITNMFPPFQTIDHAWSIKDDIVYDAVLEKEYDWEAYKSLFKAKAEREYTAKEAWTKAEETGNYGCWHEAKELNLDKYYENGTLKKEYR